MDILKAVFIGMYFAFCLGIATGANAEENDMMILVPANEHFCFDCPTTETFGLQSYRDHYAACVTQNFQLSQALSQCVFVDSDPDCRDCFDGDKTGCTWKPVAESNSRNSVLLMPADYEDTEASIEGAFVTRRISADRGVNGGRPHWFFNKTGDQFDGPITVEFTDGRCLTIENPAVRND